MAKSNRRRQILAWSLIFFGLTAPLGWYCWIVSVAPRAKVDEPPNERPFGIPRLQWEYRLDAEACVAAPLVHEDSVFVAGASGGIYKLDGHSGRLLWKVKVKRCVEATPAFRNGLLYLADEDGEITCLDGVAGEEKWTFATDGQISASATFHRDAMLIGSQDRFLYCLSAEKGELLWKFKAANEIRAPATIVDDHYCLVIGSCSSVLHVVDIRTGTEVRNIQLRGETIGKMAVNADRVMLADMRGNVTAIDWRKGEEIWSRELDPQGAPEVRGGPTLANKMVLVGANDRYVRSCDANTGHSTWQVRVSGPIFTTVHVRGDHAFVVTSRGKLHVLRTADGSEVWQDDFGGPMRLAIADTKMVVAMESGDVKCFALDSDF